VLGLATIAAPLTGSMAVAASKATNGTVSKAVSTLAVAPAFPLRERSSVTVQSRTLIPDDSPIDSVPDGLAAPSTLIVDRVSRSDQRAVLPGCNGRAPVVNYPNGHVPATALCTLWDRKYQLRSDAAVALAKLNIYFKQKFGHDIGLNSAYRTYAEQVAVRAARGYMAAPAGTSNHGWALAVDLASVPTYNAEYWWLRQNAPAFGFDSPDWARPGGSLHEAWHWEFVAGVQSVGSDA
jgi:hypothetical protein